MRKGPSYRTSLGYLPFALRRRFGYVALPATLPEVWVVSPGGVGTTALMAHLERFARINARDDSDGLKHLPRPPRLPPGAAVRFLFISGPADAICDSLARRGWTEDQAANLGAPLALLLRGVPQRRALSNAIGRQRRAWTKAPLAPTLCVDYGELWEAGPRIAAFLGITDPAFVTGYPRRRPRTAPDSDPA
jgi:hypothetical protein